MRNILFLAFTGLLAACGEASSTDLRQVWAERIENQSQLIGGRNARGKIGDYKIWNRKVAFVVQDVGLASGYQRYGGNVVDADIVRPEGEKGNSLLGTLFFGFDQRLFYPRQIEIVSDGSDGRAMIEVRGEDAYFEWLGSFMDGVLPMDPLNCDIVYRYSLGPEDEALRIDITLIERLGRELKVSMPEVAFIMGDGLQTFYPGPGFNYKEHSGEFPFWQAAGEGVSYGLRGEGPLNLVMTYEGISFGTFPTMVVPAGGQTTVVRYLAVADGNLWKIDKILSDNFSLRSEGTVRGKVLCVSGKPVQRPVRIHVLSPEKEHISLIVAADDGSFQARLPEGKYLLVAKADGYVPSEEKAVEIAPGTEVSLELALPDSVPFEVEVRDSNGDNLPARISFFRQDGAATNILPEGFGEERYQNGTALTLYSAGRKENGLLPPGRYKIIASRGLEYEFDIKEIDLNATSNLTFTLSQPVDSSGYLAGDFHIHAQYSPDSNLLPEFRVATALSEGLELLVMTEHDTMRDFQPVVERMGVRDFIRAITGSEITTYVYGHFNAWPLTEKPDRLNNGGIEWFNTPAPELLRRIRESEPHPVIIQVNHPRSQGIGGYFSAVGLDISSGTIEHFDNWTEDFDAVEVFNGSCSNGEGEEVRDFFDLLNRGYRVSVSAGTDSHSEFSTLSVPRVYVPTKNDTNTFDPQELVEAFKNQRVFVSCGPFVRFEVNGRGLGEMVSATGKVTASVRIEAPSWMTLSEFRLVKNGEVVYSSPAAQWPAANGAVRFDGEIQIEVERDCWLALEVKGIGNVSPLDGDTPYALTNPIYIDTDGNGRFDPLLPKYRAR